MVRQGAKKAVPAPRRPSHGVRAGKAFAQVASNKLIDVEADRLMLRRDELTVAQVLRELMKLPDKTIVHTVMVENGVVRVERQRRPAAT